MPVKKRKKASAPLTPEQKRNSDIFRLRGFHANAKTLPFDARGMKLITEAIDEALIELGAQTQTDYLKTKS